MKNATKAMSDQSNQDITEIQTLDALEEQAFKAEQEILNKSARPRLTTREHLKYEKEKHYFEVGVEHLLDNRFPAGHLFHVIVEEKLYKKSESPMMQGERRMNAPTVAEVYFNNEYLCDVHERMSPDVLVARVREYFNKKFDVSKTIYGADGQPVIIPKRLL